MFCQTLLLCFFLIKILKSYHKGVDTWHLMKLPLDWYLSFVYLLYQPTCFAPLVYPVNRDCCTRWHTAPICHLRNEMLMITIIICRADNTSRLWFVRSHNHQIHGSKRDDIHGISTVPVQHCQKQKRQAKKWWRRRNREMTRVAPCVELHWEAENKIV